MGIRDCTTTVEDRWKKKEKCNVRRGDGDIRGKKTGLVSSVGQEVFYVCVDRGDKKTCAL